ncbi:polysaccharide lyase family 8 protein [Panaeolus papilionaceus]|nr:polysaccharide lyase family 8 protein [Panaeolus papilionaceus]
MRPMHIPLLSFLFLTLFSISSFAKLYSPRSHRAHFSRQNNGSSSSSGGLSPVVQGMQDRRIVTIFDALRPYMSTSDLAAWLQTLDSNGKWPDSEVDYTVGCEARRANWPAGAHWRRILLMAASWHGDPNGSAGSNYVGDVDLRSAISRAMNYWFNRDITNLQCIHSGGTTSCPCDDPEKTFWNTNWFSNVILIPRDVGQTCLLLNTGVLTEYQLGKCKEMTSRSYNLFGQPFGFLQGANILDIARLGVDGALLISNMTLISDAYRRIHLEMTLKNEIKADGIRNDGSFGQHKGLLYNGNYGKDFINGLVDLELVAVGTEYAAPTDIQASLETLIFGSQWMTIRNVLTKTTHWDLSVLSRFLIFPVADLQATSGLRLTLPSLGELGRKWGSSAIANFISAASKNTTSANAGDLVGNRHFYANDYMVHRGPNFVTTVKTYSSRTLNSECTNTQNPLGFHLSDNAVRTYIRGDEYEDIAAAWDWYLIPGATIDYGATPLNCKTTTVTGLEEFVGGVSDGTLGISVMRYTNPRTKALRWQKAWFFLHGGMQHAMLSNLSAASSSSSIRSVIEQRRQGGPIFLNGNQVSSTTTSQVQTLWHGDVGYVFSNISNTGRMVIDSKHATGDWASIGTSTQPSSTIQLFSAYIEHSQPLTQFSYSILPGVSQKEFTHKSSKMKLKTLQDDNNISSIFDEASKVVFAVFWQPNGGNVTFETNGPKAESITLVAHDNIALIYKMDIGEITVSDPSQRLANTVITLTKEPAKRSKNTGIDLTGVERGSHGGPKHGNEAIHINIDFPNGGLSGKSVTRSIT